MNSYMFMFLSIVVVCITYAIVSIVTTYIECNKYNTDKHNNQAELTKKELENWILKHTDK